MRITYDKSADAAYIYLRPIERGGVANTYVCDPDEIDGWINLDFDDDGRMIGIEVLHASKKLPPTVLALAERIDLEDDASTLM